MLRSTKTVGITYRFKVFAKGQHRTGQLRNFSEVYQPYSENYYSRGDQVLATIIRDEPNDIEYALRTELKVDCVLKEVRAVTYVTRRSYRK